MGNPKLSLKHILAIRKVMEGHAQHYEFLSHEQAEKIRQQYPKLQVDKFMDPSAEQWEKMKKTLCLEEPCQHCWYSITQSN